MANIMRLGGGSGGSKLPKGYTLLPYIESTGTQYIDTGFKPDQNTRVIADIEVTKMASSNFVAFGCRVASNNCDYSVWYNYSDPTTMYSNCGNKSATLTVPTSLARLTIDKNKNVTTINGVTAQSVENSFAKTLNLFLFSLNENGASNRRASAKLYSCQIYDNGDLIRDFVPCVNESGVAGLYDLVAKKFYGNEGGGEFYTPLQIPETPVLLWQNASPSSWFSAQTVSVAGDAYDAYLVEVKGFSASNLANGCGITMVKKDNLKYTLSSIGNSVSNIAFRSVIANGNGLTFDDNSFSAVMSAGATVSKNLDNAIPQRIWGVKFTL